MNRFIIAPEIWNEIMNKISDSYEGEISNKIDPFQSESEAPTVDKFFDIELSNFWNKSVQDLYDDWKEYYGEEDHAININGFTHKIKEFAHGDAGYDFNKQYVQPQLIGQNNKYSPDFVAAAQDSKNLQFTNTQLKNNNYTYRLLMPKNIRRVEAEDLTRNFWVISQVLNGIVNFLFTDNSPYAKFYEGIIKELKELWENVLFLWFNAEMLGKQKVAEGLHIEFVPIDSDSPYKRQFDNYTEREKSEEEILEILKDYYYKYPESNLLLIPYSRSAPFYRNYHTTLKFYLLCFFIRKNNYEVNSWDDPKCRKIKNFTKPLEIDINNYLENITAIREKGKILRLGRPLSKVPNFEENDEGIYYGQIRVVPDIKINDDINNLGITMKLSLYDVGEYYRSGEEDINSENTLLQAFYFTCSEKQDESIEYVESEIFPKNPLPFFNYPRRNYGGYKGETLTTIRHSIKKRNYIAGEKTSISLKGDLFRVGNFMGELPEENNVIREGIYEFREQINDSHTHTNYLTNIGMGGFQNGSPAPENWSKLGGAEWMPNESLFYTPVAREESNIRKSPQDNVEDPWTWGGSATEFHWTCIDDSSSGTIPDDYWDKLIAGDSSFIERNTYKVEEVTKQSIKYIGLVTLKRLLLNNNYLRYLKKVRAIDWTLDDPITFMGAYGVDTWGGKGVGDNGNVADQLYWATVILSGLYIFLPEKFLDYAKDFEKTYPINIEIKQGEKNLGRLFFLREINKSEINFGNPDEYLKRVGGVPWRLVRNIGNSEVGVNYVEIFDEEQRLLGYIGLSQDESKEYEQTMDKNRYVTNLINNSAARLKTKDEILVELINGVFSSNNGIWRVYDGNDTNEEGNKSDYLNYRQVVDARYKLNGSGAQETLGFSAIAIRRRDTTLFTNVGNSTDPNFEEASNLIWSNRGLMPDSGGYSGNTWNQG